MSVVTGRTGAPDGRGDHRPHERPVAMLADHGSPGLEDPARRVRALLLNATHEPLAVLAARRALVLVLAGKADCLLEREKAAYHSPSVSIVIPAVLRLRRYVRIPYSPAVSVSRAGVLRRDRRRCAYCGAGADTIDHVVPRSRGGSHSWENCVACCHRCNTRKADRLLGEIGWDLRVLPGAPRRVGAGGIWFGEDADPAWGPWLAFAA